VSTITVQINDVTVNGKPGITILELARELGMPIPTLCHDPHLSPAGACRICLVEEVTRGVLLPSCVTAIAPGMVIKTDSPRVMESRRTILELLMASHPESCIVCDKGNRCQLRALAADMGIGILLLDPMPQFFPMHDFNPFFKRDMSKCILCGKCIRGDQELVVEGVLEYSHRGFPSRPTTFQNLPLEKAGCTFCGTCLSLCPTGALSETGLLHQGSISNCTASVCTHCACGCSLSLETCSDRIIRALPGPVSSQRGGALCVKGHFGFNYIHNPERLRRPLLRKDGALTEVSWEEALGVLKDRFQTIRREAGPKAIGCLAGPQLSNEELYLFQKLARLGFKTPNLDNGASLYAAPALRAIAKTLGLNGPALPLENILKSDCLLVVGADPTETAPVVGYMIKRAVRQHQAKLIVIDPRKTKLASLATLWLRPRPGTDLALIQGLIQTLMIENLWNQGFLQSQTEGFSEWRESFLKLDIKSELAATGLEETEVQEAARSLAASQGLSVILGNGITQQTNATAAVMAVCNLVLLLGQRGLPGSGVYPLLKESNALGAWEMGVLPEQLPGYQSASDPKALKKFEAKWGDQIPEGPGLSALEMIAAARKGELKGLYLASEDPLGTYPDRAWVEEALGQLEFLVVQDLFLTETAQMAHLVLPTAGPAEKEGTYTNLERRIQRAHRAVPPPGQAKPDGEIFSLILKAMNNGKKPMALTGQGEGPQDMAGRPESMTASLTALPDLLREVFAEIREMVPGYDRITLDGLDQGPSYLNAGLSPLQAGSFEIPRTPLDKPAQNPDYPFILITGGLLPHVGAGTRTWKDPRLKAITPSPQVTFSPQDAEALKITPGDNVRIQSERGSLSVSARIGDEVPAGVLFFPLPYPDLKINVLFEASWDPISKGSRHKLCPVRIVKD
jgi:formate dehydrogenase (NADP+) alpha subunit